MDQKSLKENLENYLSTQNESITRVSGLNEINMGWETELFTFKAVHNELEEDLVLRIFSGERAGSKASKEYYLMRRLDEVGYPVPHIYHIDAIGDVIGKPFLIMERVMGATLDAAFKSTIDEKLQQGIHRLIELLVKLHKLDVSQFDGLLNLSTLSISDILSRYQKACEKNIPWLKPVIEWLSEHQPEDAEEYLALCHNDYHGMNVMLNQQNQAFVIDWGASIICDSRIDLAWTILLYTTIGGAMYRAPLIEIYSELGGKVDDLTFFEVLAATRRIVDLGSVVFGTGTYGLKPDVLNLMRERREHFMKVHDFLETRTGIRLKEYDTLLASF
ncbi:MAG: phosphotransferase [Candidatus Bathyarchaeota archaeon]|nr:phosphotransferase [Candidatus Bathyarchaeota archaeon]